MCSKALSSLGQFGTEIDISENSKKMHRRSKLYKLNYKISIYDLSLGCLPTFERFCMLKIKMVFGPVFAYVETVLGNFSRKIEKFRGLLSIRTIWTKASIKSIKSIKLQKSRQFS